MSAISTSFSVLLLLLTLGSGIPSCAQQSTVPEEARRYYVQANALFRTAQSKDDFQQVLALYRQALAVDPQYGNAWYNLSKVQEKLEQYDGAIASLKQFLAVSPNDPEARAAQDHEYELEALKGKAESPEARWAKFLQSLEGGVWYAEVVHYPNVSPRQNFMTILEIHNGMLSDKSISWTDGYPEPDPSQLSDSQIYPAVDGGMWVPVTGRQLTYTSFAAAGVSCLTTFDIAESGDPITDTYRCQGGRYQYTHTYVRKK